MRAALAAVLLFAGCSSACPKPPALPEPPAVVPPPPPSPVAPPALAQPIAKVAQQYHAAASKEGPAITAAGATADFVRRVHEADLAAQRALRALRTRSRHGRPDPVALTAARAAVAHLAAVLDSGPE
jgi:hypothetical protein